MALGQYLEEKYGKNSMLMLVDEGSGLDERFGQVRSPRRLLAFS